VRRFDIRLTRLLNGLCEINNERIDGYERAADGTEDELLKPFFLEMAGRSNQFNQWLAEEIERLGGSPTDDMSTSGKFSRIWADVRSGLIGRNRLAVLDLCETEEKVALEAYETVLRSNSLDEPRIRTLVEMQHETLEEEHAKIRFLRKAAAAEGR
jgi:uncharacterized protein (TIGR02284 family)